jgi:hypothetical protein
MFRTSYLRMGLVLLTVGILLCFSLLSINVSAEGEDLPARAQGDGDDPLIPGDEPRARIHSHRDHLPHVVKETIPSGTIDGSDGQMVVIYLLVGIVAFLVMVAFL